MFIKSLHLENFRSYEKLDIAFENITVLIGSNGIGKTNVLEAIWLLADGRSWRTGRDVEAIQWGKDFAKISGVINKENEELTLELFLQNPGVNYQIPTKTLKIGGVKKRLIDLLGQMPAVLFSPEALGLVSGSPSLRRKFIDIMLSQVDYKYVYNLVSYQKVLRERNKLLFFLKIGRAKLDELEFWDEKIIDLGEKILAERVKVFDFFNKNLSAAYQEIADNNVKMKLNYKPSVKPGEYKKNLKDIRSREIEKALTLIGPHRDDWEISLGGRNLAHFGSRGEYRSAVLALKVMETNFLKERTGENPILLLDDIFSELDSARRKHLTKIIKENQTIITTTDLDHIEKGLRKEIKIVEMGK